MSLRSHSRRVILCIDDHANGLITRKQILERAGYAVLTATSVHRALELFRTNHIDLVLTERVAPAMVDGATIAAAMKMLNPEVPVAIFSADIDVSPEDMRRADVFITKLVSIEELLELVRHLIMKREVNRRGRLAA